MESNLTIKEILLSLQNIQYQINKIHSLIDVVSSNDPSFLEEAKKAESKIKEMSIDEMKTHGTTPEEIVDWYWNHYTPSELFVTTPNGDHPIDYLEWSEGRKKNNKEILVEYYKDFMIRVIDKGGFIQAIPF